MAGAGLGTAASTCNGIYNGRSYIPNTRLVPCRCGCTRAAPCLRPVSGWQCHGMLPASAAASWPRTTSTSACQQQCSYAHEAMMICCVVADGLRADFTFSDEGMRRAVAQCRVAGCCRLGSFGMASSLMTACACHACCLQSATRYACMVHRSVIGVLLGRTV